MKASFSPSPKSNRFSRVIAENPGKVGYWGDEWRVDGKSVAKIRFGSFCVRKATAEGKLKTRPCVK
ncbi:hypothetical protein FD723_33190 (plasmid) [Nostoc sp. C052]|nr:hypothetical protein FD723_33190 [Nostoc sp. C052]